MKEEDDFFQRLMDGYLRDLSGMMEMAQLDLYAPSVQSQAWEVPAYESRVKWVAACQAFVELYEALLKDARHWLAQQVLNWALRQLEDAALYEPALQETSQLYGKDVEITQVEYEVIPHPERPTSGCRQLSFWLF